MQDSDTQLENVKIRLLSRMLDIASHLNMQDKDVHTELDLLSKVYQRLVSVSNTTNTEGK